MLGTMKSGLVSRGLPRSSATMESPVSDSSLARMPPVQPSPTMTISTDFRRVSIGAPSAQIFDGFRFNGVWLVAVLLHHVDVVADRAGKADHLPGGLVAVAAVERVAEIAFDRVLQQQIEECARRHLRELRFAGIDLLERGDAVGGPKLLERLA